MLNKQTLICTVLVALMLACTFAHAQTCKTKTPNFEPTTCSQCTTCSSTSSKSCCDASMDASAASAVALFNTAGAPSACIDFIKEYSCAVCDPKNQGLFTVASGVYNLNMCKSKCKSMESACGSSFTSILNIKCDTFPETDCWNSANSFNAAHAMVAVIISLISFFMF